MHYVDHVHYPGSSLFFAFSDLFMADGSAFCLNSFVYILLKNNRYCTCVTFQVMAIIVYYMTIELESRFSLSQESNCKNVSTYTYSRFWVKDEVGQGKKLFNGLYSFGR